MNVYKFKYIVSSEREAYVYADSLESAKDKVENIIPRNGEWEYRQRL